MTVSIALFTALAAPVFIDTAFVLVSIGSAAHAVLWCAIF